MLCLEYVLFSLALRLENALFALWTRKLPIFNKGDLIKVNDVPAHGGGGVD